MAYHRRQLAGSHANLGVLLREMRKLPEAEDEHRQAHTLIKQLVDDFPTVPEYRRDLAASHFIRAIALWNMRKWTDAVAERRYALKLQKQLAAEFPVVPEFRQDLARTHNDLGAWMCVLGRSAEAEAEYGQAIALRKKLVDDFPTVPDYVIELGGSYCNFGILLDEEAGKPMEALNWFQQAIETLMPLVEREPRLVTAREFLRNSHWSRAIALMKLDRFAEAIKDWDRLFELGGSERPPSFRLQRAVCLARVEPAKAVTEAEELIKGDKTSTGILYDAACVYSLSSAQVKDNAQREKYAGGSVVLLRRAHAGGFFRDKARIEHLKKDSDLAPLRSREDFAKLLAELQASTPAKKEAKMP